MKLLPLSLVILLLAGGCVRESLGGTAKTLDANRKLRVVATTAMVADMARNVMGDRAEVEALMGPGVDPHLYKASPGDISKINKADLILYNGLHLEGKMADVFENVAKRKPVIALAESLPQERLLQGAQTATDPHVWFDVSLWKETADPLAKKLAELDPTHREDYAVRAVRYAEELGELHEDVKEELATIPKERRVLVTAHDAFQYFGRAYGVEVRGIQGISTESEAGLREINGLVQLLVERSIPAVFVESSVSEKNIQALVEGAGRRAHRVKIGGSLFSDAMGKAGTPEGTYVGMVRHNVRMIVGALKG